jgi:microcystin degradation protein MlrC
MTGLRNTPVVIAASGLLLLTAACGGGRTRPIRIAVGTFAHETCTFCPDSTGIDDWEYYGPPLRGAEVLAQGEYIGGFVREVGLTEGVDLVGVYSPRDARGGSSGSWITRAAFEKYSRGMVEDIRAALPLDGVFLALHGAMAVDGVPKPEAELVRRVRAAVGAIPIFVTLDLHANEDHELSDAADAVFIVKRYPHYDTGFQGERAARVLLRTIRGQYRPVMATRKPKVITPSVFQGTGVSPAMEIMERARRWEERIPGLYVSVAFGFAYADVADAGAVVMVVADGDQALADRVAQDVSDYIWQVREVFAGKVLPKTREGVRQAIQAARTGQIPVVLADHADRTGNSNHVLAELLRQGAERFAIATLSDSLALKALAGRRVGERVRVSVGGWADRFAGEPLTVEGTLDYLGHYDGYEQVAVIGLPGESHLILTPLLEQVTDTGIFAPLGIDWHRLDIIVLKSRVHFRRGYYETGIAGTIIEVDAPGLGPADLTTLDYHNVPKDLYPLSGRK